MWGSMLFATLVPLSVVVLAGLLRLSFHQGRLSQRVTETEHDVRDVKNDVRDLFKVLGRGLAPSERRDRRNGT